MGKKITDSPKQIVEKNDRKFPLSEDCSFGLLAERKFSGIIREWELLQISRKMRKTKAALVKVYAIFRVVLLFILIPS